MAESIVGESSSSSSSSSKSSCTHHVFLSFRGDDTRMGFLSHLYAALQLKGITTFKDDRLLQIGDDISHQLIRAIQESMFAIVLLSNNYAHSTWCLNELQKIVECKDEKGLSIVPVFYDVDPSHVRYQKGSFEEAFTKHEGRLGSDSVKIKKWRDALTKVAGCSGWESKNMDEATLVESIAEDIFKKLIPKLPSFIDNHVGILSKVEKVYSLLGLGLNDVRFIGIWGMGGIGKTTIVRTVYEAIQADFKVSCFLSRVRERCDEKNGIVQIQQDFAKCVNISSGSFNNELDGRRVIQNSLCNKKVLLVIDDVNDAIQLENLAGSQNWFGPGSRIIITTRDLHLLMVHGVHGSYKAEGLNENEAMHLFCLKAFKQDEPKEGYLDLSKEVVKYCDGLPLALEVLGSYLCARGISFWHSGIKKIKSVPNSKILDKLKISYDDLDSMEKHVFLDIACFFKGEEKDYIIDILEKCGYNSQIEIEVLIERSLITLNKEYRVEMHDLVEEMGKNIVIQESANDPGNRSRLWSEDDINFVLTKNKGTEAIQGMVIPFFYKGGCSMEAFSNMNQLKLLIMRVWELPHGLKLPSSLKVLRWRGCHLKTLPLADEQYELADIELQFGELQQLWHGEKILEKLKTLILYECKELEQMPDLTCLPNLETLVLHGCTSITKVHSSLIKHKKLVVLNLSDCLKIRTFSGRLEMSSLKELILDSCTDLEDLPEFGECMKHLSRLILSYTGICKLPSSLRCLVGLEELNITSTNIVCFPDVIQELKSLRILDVSFCRFLGKMPSFISHLPFLSSLNLSYCGLTEEDIPLDFCHFPSLMELDLSGNMFVSVPMNIHKIPKLRHLILNDCENLLSLPELPASIREIDARRCYSLDTSEFNLLSKACNVFASSSSSEDHGEVVLQMVIAGKKIPSWFVHKEYGNCVSVPPQHDFSDENGSLLGIALCFQIDLPPAPYGICLAVHNGNRSITNKRVSVDFPGEESLYMIYLRNRYCLNEEIHLDKPFQLICHPTILGFTAKVWSCAAGWIHKHVSEGFNKSQAEGGTKRS